MKKKNGLHGSKNAIFILLAALACAVPVTSVCAAGNQPCAEDVVKFCSGVQPGGGRMAQCLAAHIQDISPACKTRITEVKNRMINISEACEDDVEQLCTDIRPLGGRVLKCLREHVDEVSSECKATLVDVKRKRIINR